MQWREAVVESGGDNGSVQASPSFSSADLHLGLELGELPFLKVLGAFLGSGRD
jgi:hypothetical protein